MTEQSAHEARLTGAEMERLLGGGTRYESLSLKFYVDGFGEFEIDCAPGELTFQARREVDDMELADSPVPSVLLASAQLVLRLELRPHGREINPLATIRQAD